jgi:hypothetical protein
MDRQKLIERLESDDFTPMRRMQAQPGGWLQRSDADGGVKDKREENKRWKGDWSQSWIRQED